MADGIGLAEKMLGLPGLVVLEVDDVPGELVVRVESTRTKAVCPSCRRRGQGQDRTEIHLRDLHCFGRPTRLVINKRRWRCTTTGCVKKTWTEKIAGVAARQVLAAKPEHSTIYATSLVDLDRRIVIDLFEGKSAAKLRKWCETRSGRWRKGVKVVALDLTDTYRAGLSPHLSHAIRVADPFHVTRVANRMLDQVRRRVQNETLGHRGRKAGPLFRIRKLLLSVTSDSMSAVGRSSWPGCAWAIPTTRCWEPGWPKNRSARSI